MCRTARRTGTHTLPVRQKDLGRIRFDPSYCAQIRRLTHFNSNLAAWLLSDPLQYRKQNRLLEGREAHSPRRSQAKKGKTQGKPCTLSRVHGPQALSKLLLFTRNVPKVEPPFVEGHRVCLASAERNLTGVSLTPMVSPPQSPTRGGDVLFDSDPQNDPEVPLYTCKFTGASRWSSPPSRSPGQALFFTAGQCSQLPPRQILRAFTPENQNKLCPPFPTRPLGT
jgi:hypothetical protein